MQCHENLIRPFTMFLINDGYDYSVGKNMITFCKPTKPQIKINKHGVMNDAGASRYAVFLKMWLQRGKEFIAKLSAQFYLMMVAE